MSAIRRQAVQQALGLIKAGLDSKSIQLCGTAGGESPSAAAEKDVKYLTGLISGLTAAILTTEDSE